MTKRNQPAIYRLAAHHGGPSALHRLIPLASRPKYQRIQEWIARGWASPMHIPALEPLLPAGIGREELHEDRERAKRLTRAAEVR